MASAELHSEVRCSLCQNLYTDPVTLRCGHNFCRGCMEIELRDQDEVGCYTCPTCGKRFSSRPSLQEKPELSDRVERQRCAREKNFKVLCMNCSAPAGKTCVQCFGSVCGKHLAEHETHRLIDPTSLESRKCRAHLRLRDYYCTEDSTCICSDCFVVGDHKGHSVEPLEEASKKEKETPSRTEEQRRGKHGEHLSCSTAHRRHPLPDPPLRWSLNGHSVQDDVSEDKPCNGHTDQTDVKDAVHKHQDSTVVKMDPVITEGTHRLDAKSAGLLQCSKSKLQLLVNSPLVIDFTMVMNWDNLMPDNYKNKYEIRSPLFNINTSAPHEISDVYLPHSLCPKEFEINKPYLKCGHFEDGIFNLVSPSEVESSHVILKGATYTSVGVLIENAQTRKRKQAQARGTVLIYCKQVTNGFLIHVYLVPMSKSQVKKVIETKETGLGFRWIDKSPYIKFVNKDITYTIRGSEGVTLENEELHCLYSVSEHYPYASLRVPEKCTTVKLHISEKAEKEDIWSCVLNEEDLYGMTGTPSTSSSPSDSEDPKAMNGTPSTSSSPSELGKARTFLQENYENLCHRLGVLEPMLLSLNEKQIITEHEEQSIKSHNMKLQQNRALLHMVKSKGAEEEFYKTLKKTDPCLVQSLEQPT